MNSSLIDRIDGLSSSAAIKAPARVATTANIVLSGLQTVDGVALATGDRVLVKDQTAAWQNGIYRVDTGPWSRVKDFNKTRDVVRGTVVFVNEGANARRAFMVATEGIISIGTSSITFELADNFILEAIEQRLATIALFNAVGNGVYNNAASFQAAETAFGLASPIYVPPGTYLTTYTPLGLYYGPGTIKIGSEIIPLDYRVAQKVNTTPPGVGDEDDESGVPERRQNWVSGQGAGLGLSASADANVILGYKAGLGQTDEGRLTAIGYLAGGTADGYADTIIGASAASQSAYRERNVVIGATGGKWLGTDDPAGTDHDIWIAPDSTFFGLATRNPTFWSLLTVSGTARGTPLAAKLPTQNSDAARNVIIGRDAGNHAPKMFGCVTIGYRAGRFFYNAEDSVAIGYEALGDGLFAYRSNAIGSTAMNYCQTGQYNDAFGYAAMKYNAFADFNTAIGAFAMLNMGSTFTVSATAKAVIEGNVAIGKDALRYAEQGLYNTAVGMQAIGVGVSTGNRNSAYGFFSLSSNTTGGNNTAIGQRAAYQNTTGSNIVALGGQALEVKQDASPMTNLSNVIGIGFNAAVSGSDQAQIGNSSVTTYVYGTVQNRSDERDKANIRKISAGTEFLRAVAQEATAEYQWDMREDYVQELFPLPDELKPLPEGADDQAIADHEEAQAAWLEAADAVYEQRKAWWSNPEKDGSKARTRFHSGVIYQRLKEICDRLGYDFAGLQDHSMNGGTDTGSVGYDEFIAHLINDNDRLWTAIEQADARIAALENAA